MISYTRNFEDVMLQRALAHISQGFYVDVGASHPVTDSNTYALYTKGWRGVAIEPQGGWAHQWQEFRPQDVFVQAAAGAHEGHMMLYTPVDYGQGATTRSDFAAGYAQRGLNMNQTPVPVCTLTKVLEQARPHGEIHLLSIDVEGAERDVIAGLDWARFRPWLVVMESTLPGVPTPNYQEWESFLLAQGYAFVYFDAVNRFYVAHEHEALKAHFSHPPCVWDDFIGHELQHWRARVPVLENELAEHKQRQNQLAQSLLAAAIRFRDASDWVACEALLWRLFELVPTFEDTYWPLGQLLIAQERRAEALAFYQAAAKHAPHHVYNHHNIGMLMRWEKRWDEAQEAFERMMVVDPNFHLGRRNYAMLHLALGRYKEGWELMESRYLTVDDGDVQMAHNAPYPQWHGESLEGKTILVLREQGYGDAIMFARFLILLKQRGAARTMLLCRPLIKSLLQTVQGLDEALCIDELNDCWPDADFWCYEQSLPHVLGITLDNLPANIPYIFAPEQAQAKWRERIRQELPAHTLKVGLTWRGNAKHGNDRYRSLPHLSVLRPLWEVPGISFVSVQTDEASAQAAHPPQDQPLVEWGSQLKDFADGAALVSELDLLISVDTGIVHVAGALGAPCWVLVPRIETDWRWLTDRSDSPWYPKEMRIFRQTQESNWDDVIDNIKTELQNWAALRLAARHPKVEPC